MKGSERRPDGGLEQDVLRTLWANPDAPMTPGDVNRELGEQLAYTTVMTVLTRLWNKGLLERVQVGRAYAYRPVMSESALVGQRMSEALATSGDRHSALTQFVEQLSAKDVRHLRRLLGQLGDSAP